jgi:hypothetical protein
VLRIPFTTWFASASSATRALFLGMFILSLTIATADARRHERQRLGFPFNFIERIFQAPQGHMRGHKPNQIARGVRDLGARRPERNGLLAQVPADWKLQPSEPGYQGQQYLSPNSAARLAFYSTPVNGGSQEQHARKIAFVDGEDVTYLLRESDRVAVSGFTDATRKRIFYRKAVLACDGQQWRHVEVEYPMERKQDFDRHVAKLAQALDGTIKKACENISAGSG